MSALAPQAKAAIGTSFISRARRQEAWEGRFFAYPVVIGTLIFNVLPMLPSLYFSLTDWDMLGHANFKGLENYAQLASDGEYRHALWITILYTIGSIPLAMSMGLLLAVMVNQKIRGVTWFRGLYFLPVVTSQIAIAMVWRWMFNTNYGVINFLLSLVGIDGPRWLGHPTWALVAVVVVSVWQAMGYNMVIFLAGLQGIPTHLYEAAEIDGASPLRRFLHVTVPLLTPTTFFIMIMSIIGSFQVFGTVYMMTQGGPGNATAVYVYYLWQTAFELFHMGYASAMAWILFLIISSITLFQWWMAKRWVFYQ